MTLRGEKGRRDERWPLELSRWRTSEVAMALMRRWFRGAGLADGRESHSLTLSLTHTHTQKKQHRDGLFKYHLVFITQTYTRALAACFQIHSHYFTTSSALPSFHKLRHFAVMRWARAPNAESWPSGSWETHFGHRWLNHRVLWLLGGYEVSCLSLQFDSKEATFTQLWAPAWALHDLRLRAVGGLSINTDIIAFLQL